MTTNNLNDSGTEPGAADNRLDVTGLTCPMPLLKAKQALNKLKAGERLQVRATDPGSVRDFAVFAKQSGHALLESTSLQEAGAEVFIYLLQKKAD